MADRAEVRVGCSGGCITAGGDGEEVGYQNVSTYPFLSVMGWVKCGDEAIADSSDTLFSKFYFAIRRRLFDLSFKLAVRRRRAFNCSVNLTLNKIEINISPSAIYCSLEPTPLSLYSMTKR
jgi:hypothetical protein